MSKDKIEAKAVREFRRVVARAIAIRHLKQQMQSQTLLGKKLDTDQHRPKTSSFLRDNAIESR